jgi:hypothetical protein
MRRLGGLLAVLALVLTGCGGTTNPGSGAADLVPATAPVFVAIDTDPGSSQWQMVDDLAGKFPDKQKAIDSAKKSMRKEGLDWDRDITPALGPEIDVVMLDLEHPGETVGLMQPKDKGAFERAVKKGNVSSDPGDKLFYEEYHGWEVMADKPSAIDAFKQASESAQRTLAEDKVFTGAMDKSGEGIVRAYVNGPKVMAVARKAAGPGEQPFIDKLGKLDWLLMRLRAKSDGIGLDAIVHGTPGEALRSSGSSASVGSLRKLVPQDALVYLAFHGSKGMLGGLEDNPMLQQEPGFEQFARIFREVGAILQGENALYVRAPAGRRLPEVTFLAAPGAGVNGAAVLDRVLNRFRKEIGGRPRRARIAGVPARLVGPGNPAVMYANVNGKLVVTDYASGIRFTRQGGKALTDSDAYQEAASSAGLPDRPQTVLYVDIHSTVPAVERLANTPVPAEVKRNLAPLRSAVEYAVKRSHELEISFFLRIK